MGRIPYVQQARIFLFADGIDLPTQAHLLYGLIIFSSEIEQSVHNLF